MAVSFSNMMIVHRYVVEGCLVFYRQWLGSFIFYTRRFKIMKKWLSLLILFVMFSCAKDSSDGVSVKVTAYTIAADETLSDSVGITASGKKAKVGMCALSRDLEKDLGLSFGDSVTVQVNGKRYRLVFEDRMNKRWKHKVDILMVSKKEALKFGLQEGLLFY